MMLNYNPLDIGRDTWSKNDVGDSTASPPGRTPARTLWWRFCMAFVAIFALSLNYAYAGEPISGTPNSPESAVTTCANAILIPSLPVSSQSLVCGTGNDLSSTTVPATCGGASNSYKGGLEALYRVTPSTTSGYSISISGQTWTGIFVYQGCPTSGGVCVGSVGSSTASKSLDVSLTAGVEYYIWFDTWPSPASPCPGTFSITQIVTPPNCIASPTTPTNASTGKVTPTLTWPAATGSPTGYTLYLGTDGGGTATPTNVVNGAALGNVTTTNITATLSPSTLYYWQIVPTNNNGPAVGCAIWSFTTGAQPNCVTTSTPANLATNVVRNPTITWTAPTGSPSSYDLYFGTTPSPAFVANVTTTSYTPGLLAANTTYYLRFAPRNVTGANTTCSEISFTTGTNIVYCIPSTSSGCTDGDVIARVVLNTLDNNSGTGCPSGLAGYSDYTSNPALTTELQAGGSYGATVWAGEWAQGYAVWIDYNDDGDFTDPGERIGYSNGMVAGSGADGVLGASATFPIVLSCAPPVGQHRMRVRGMYNTNGIDVTPCGSNSFGETEDYVITITEPDPCPAPSGLTATNTSSTGGDLSWTPGCEEDAWEVVVQAAGGGTPTGSGVQVSSPSYSVSGLPAGIYEYYVRAQCDTALFSSWTGPLVFTPPGCATLTYPADDATGVEAPGGIITFTWDAATGATSYNIMIGTTSGSLTLVTNTTALNVPITGFAFNTEYFWRIDPVGVGGTNGTCAEFSFTTAPPPANDICTGAVNLDELESPITGSTVGLTNDVVPPCSTGSTAPDAFYSITVPAGYTLEIGQNTNNYDSVHFMFYGSCATQTAIMCLDDVDETQATWTNSTGSTQTVYWVQDGFGTGAGLFELAWELIPPPVVVSSFAPTSVCGTDGGTTIVITGSNFVDVTSVQFNGLEATSFVVDSATQISAVLPAGDTAGVITVYSTPSSNGSGNSVDTLVVNPNPVVEEIVPAEAAVICVGGTADYDNPSFGGTWSTGNPAIATVDAEGVVTGVSGGETNVIYTVTLGTGCSSSVTRSIIVNDPINITSHPSGTAVVTNDPASFSVVATGSVVSADWYVSTDGGFNFDPLTIAPPYSTSYDSGSNTYTLSISAAEESMNGNYYQLAFDAADPCVDEVSFAALLSVGNTGIQTQPSPVTICSTGAGEAQFTVVGSGPVESYQWYVNWGFGPIPISGAIDEFDADVMYSGFDSATLMVSGLDTDNSGWYFSVDVVGPLNTVTSNEVLLTVNEGVSISGQPENAQACSSGDSTTLSVIYSGTISGVQWQYSTSASGPFANVANGTPAGFTYSASGDDLTVTNAAGSAVGTYYYRAVLDAAAPCSDVNSDPAMFSVTQPTISVSPSSASYCVPGPAVVLTASGGVSYSWSPSTGLDVSSGAVVNASPSSTTTYIVTGTDASGCTSTASVTVTVGPVVDASATATPSTVCPDATVQLQAVTPVVDTTVAGYSFVGSSGTYTPLVGGTNSTATGDDGSQTNIPIGFNFVYGGTNHTAFSINTNGFIRLATTVFSSPWTNNLSSTTNTNVIGALWDDNNRGSGSISYLTSGTAPNRVLTVQWANIAIGGGGSTGNQTNNFQIQLFEGTNQIRFNYGSLTSANGITASIGLTGPTVASAAKYLSVTPGSPASASTTSSTTANNGISAVTNLPSGTTYLFTPPTVYTYTYDWTSTPAGFTSSIANPTVQPSETTEYQVVITSNTGCTSTETVTVTVESGAEITTQPIGATICQGQPLTLTVEATGPGLVYQWRRDGVNVGTNSATYTVASATPANSGSYDVVITPACGASATSDAVTVTVNPTPTATAPSSATYCAGAVVPAVALTGTPSGVTYNISGGSLVGLADQTGVTSVPSFTATYGVANISITPVANGCSGTPVTYTITVNDTPSAVTATPESSSICSNDNAVLLSASGGIGGRTSAVGTSTTTTSATVNSPFSNTWEGVRSQYLILASEMTAAGFTPGNIQGLGFNVTASAGGFALLNYTVKIGTTASTALVSGTYDSAPLTTVYSNAAQPKPAVGPVLFPFNAAFAWDGTSNLLIEICHDNDTTGAGTFWDNTPTVSASTTAFNSVGGRYADNTQVCGTTNGTSVISTTRPLFSFAMTGQQFPIIWSPVTGLYTDAAATVPYTGTNSATVYAKPAAGVATFTATAQGVGSCSSNDAVQVTVTTAQDYYVDADGDGYGTGAVAYTGCAQPGYATNNTDCNDSVAAVNPGVNEIAYNGVDDNCNGTIDEGSQVFSQVQASQCGTTLVNIGSLVGLVSVPAGTGYRIEVTNTETSAVQVIERAVPNFSFTHLPVYDYATTYSIRVMVQRNGVWLNYYGNSCLVSTPAVTAPGGAAQVNPSQCGVTLSSINTLIATTSLPNTAQYRFRVTDLTDGDGPNQVQIIDRPLHWFSLKMLTRYNYGTTYSIEVAVRTTSSSTFTGYGAPCNVTTPAVPQIALCGQAIATAGTNVYTTSLNSVTSYRFVITNFNDFTVTTLDRPLHWFNFSMIPGYQPGATYGVSVAVMTSGEWSPFSDGCEIVAPGGARGNVKETAVPFNAIAYPNPFADTFGIELTTSAEASVNVKVYDMTGRMLEQKDVSVTDMPTLQVGERYPAGVYNVIVTQGEQAKTLRVIKR